MLTDFRNEWLAKLGQRLNIPELAFDDAGLCVLTLDDELLVSLCKQTDAPNLVLFGQLPISQLTPELMQRMLIENRSHGRHTAPVVSLSEDLDALEVHFKLNQDELANTEDAIGQLIGNLEYWRGNVTGAAH
jgi:hypothetical protein